MIKYFNGFYGWFYTPEEKVPDTVRIPEESDICKCGINKNDCEYHKPTPGQTSSDFDSVEHSEEELPF